jgi:hypothetical protein
MKTQQRSTVVGVFKDRLHANQAITELQKVGFGESQIGVAARHTDGVADAGSTANDTHAGSGALTGALTGLGLGTLAGRGVLAGGSETGTGGVKPGRAGVKPGRARMSR